MRYLFFHKNVLFSILFFLLLLFLSGCSREEKVITSLSQLNDSRYTIGYGEGHSAYTSLKETLPKAKLRSFGSHITGFEAVRQGKVDGYAFERLQMEMAIKEGLAGVQLLEEDLGKPIEIAVGISPVTQIPDFEKKINTFLAELRKEGTFDKIQKRWLMEGDETMPDIPEAQNPKYHLKVGTTAEVPPYSYYKGTSLNGMDIELAKRFALWLGADLEFKIFDYNGIIAAALSGDIDCIMANLNATPERRESIAFSDPLLLIANAVMVKGKTLKYNSIAEMDKEGVVLGMHTGFVLIDKLTREMLPKAKIEYYKTTADMAFMVANGKLDGFINDEPVIRYAALEVPDLGYIHCGIDPMNIVVCFPKTDKGAQLRDELDTYIRKWKNDGTLKKLDDLWLSGDEEKKVVDLTNFDGRKGTLRLATEATCPPFEYIKDGKIVGYEVDLIARFCREAGYALKIEDVPFDSIIMGLHSGMYDFAAACLSETPAHKESLNLSEAIYISEPVMAVQVIDSSKANTSWSSLCASFEKTFIREARWKLIAEGIEITIIISLLAALFGTLLGFGICGLRLSGNRIANGVALVFIRIMQGMPMVVLLMILFYVVFAKTGLSSIWVAVIGFGMNFGAYVSEMIRTGILAVDRGQMEAALALGFTEGQTFLRFVFPQAARRFLPVYRGEIISLLKSTSVVGYIAVQDLTKMSDIIRARTYEAFFPLIATALIYFLLAWIISLLMGRILRSVEPKRHSLLTGGAAR